MMFAAKDALFNKCKQQTFNRLNRPKTIKCDSERSTVRKLRAGASNKSDTGILPTPLGPRKNDLHTSVLSDYELLEGET